MYEQPQSHVLTTTIPVKENRVNVEFFDWTLSTILIRLAGETNTRKSIYTKNVISA